MSLSCSGLTTSALHAMDANLLEGISLFAGLSSEEREELARLMTVREHRAHEALFWIGDAGEEFFVVESGRVSITCPDQSGKDIHLASLGRGDFLGEISLLDGGPRSATARAQTDARLLVLDRAAFHEFIGHCPSAAIHIMTVLGKRHRETVEKLRGIRDLAEILNERMTPWQRIANTIAAMAGGHRFLMVHATLFGAWIAFNLLRGTSATDPFPFPFLCFWASVEAIFLSLFIMISQNLQTQKDRIRNELDYQVALKMQLEIMHLHQKLDAVPEAVLEQVRRMSEQGDSQNLERSLSASS
jgi:CRP/FNR family cyclic AMP-dependent transcriptional regulator